MTHGYLNFSYSNIKYLVDFRLFLPALWLGSTKTTLQAHSYMWCLWYPRSTSSKPQHQASLLPFWNPSSSTNPNIYKRGVFNLPHDGRFVYFVFTFCHLLLHIFWGHVIKSVDISIFTSFWWISPSLDYLRISSKLFPFNLLYISVSCSAHLLITELLCKIGCYHGLCLNSTHHRKLYAPYF